MKEEPSTLFVTCPREVAMLPINLGRERPSLARPTSGFVYSCSSLRSSGYPSLSFAASVARADAVPRLSSPAVSAQPRRARPSASPRPCGPAPSPRPSGVRACLSEADSWRLDSGV